MNIKNIDKIYRYCKVKFNAEEISTLSTMIYGLVKKHEERQRIIDLNREIDTLNRKCSWKSDYKPVELLEVPEI